MKSPGGALSILFVTPEQRLCGEPKWRLTRSSGAVEEGASDRVRCGKILHGLHKFLVRATKLMDTKVVSLGGP